jgi:hypothetical protein
MTPEEAMDELVKQAQELKMGYEILNTETENFKFYEKKWDGKKREKSAQDVTS